MFWNGNSVESKPHITTKLKFGNITPFSVEGGYKKTTDLIICQNTGSPVKEKCVLPSWVYYK